MKIIIWKKKAAALLAAALAAGIAGYAASYPAGAYATDRQLPIYCVDKGQQKICSISFDAAWGNVNLRQRRPASVFPALTPRPLLHPPAGGGAPRKRGRISRFFPPQTRGSARPSPPA